MENLKLAAVAAVLLPLLGSTLWFWVGRGREKVVTVGAVGALALSFLSVLYLFWKVDGSARVDLFEWIPITANYTVHFAFLFDGLSLALGLVVTGIGSLIHLYASGYMHGDPGFGRFFTYLNLFVFSMLMLTFSDNLLGLFLGWEGVGLCSYLLISFWFQEEANATAGKKAFIVNRIGDFGFLIAMFALFKAYGTVTIPELLNLIKNSNLNQMQLFWSQIACFGLILAATGKSAQIPLYIWLPDAMAGPTPVSALIHAATMVTAGVYLTCRMQGLFILRLDILEILGFIGALTAFFAATVAIFQNDIKKVLAYSTISQLGYMFLAVGIAAPTAAYFHLITHACFKALLFLGAGSVIHGLHHEQDMRHMGRLRKQMPITFWTMTIGVLAIAGVPPLSGFFSKDEILHHVWESHHLSLTILGFATAFMTAFYMGRLWVMTFFGNFRGHHEAHESPLNMTVVLIVLAVLSVIAGALNVPHLWGGGERLGEYLHPLLSQSLPNHEENLTSTLLLAGFSSLLGLAGLALAYFRYRNFSGSEFESPNLRIFKEKYYIDEIYDLVFVQNARRLGTLLWQGLDVRIIDGLLNGIATGSQRISERMRRLQTGFAQQYALWVWIGFIVLLLGAWTVR